MISGWWLAADATVACARGVVGMRSRASGVARLEAVAAPLSLIPAFLCILFIVLWTRDAGRAGAHPYHATRCEGDYDNFGHVPGSGDPT